MNERTAIAVLLTKATFAALVVFTVAVSVLPAGSVPHLESDKLGHFMAYAILTISGCLAFPNTRYLWRLALFLAGLGALLEATQSLLPTRDADYIDLAANVAGIAAGSAMFPVTMAVGRKLRLIG